MKLRNILIAVGVIVIIGLGVYFPQSNPVINQIVGSAVGPESTNDYQCYNDICTYYYKVAMNSGTTTMCSIKAPNATTTLVHLSAKFTGTETYATTYMWGADEAKSFSTSTSVVATYYIAANKTAEIMATSTQLTAPFIGNEYRHGAVMPNIRFNLKLSTTSTATGANHNPAGVCEAVFRSL